jgi:hypothetical protein
VEHGRAERIARLEAGPVDLAEGDVTIKPLSGLVDEGPNARVGVLGLGLGHGRRIALSRKN